MNKEGIREQLHTYIDIADERHLEAIYVLVEKELKATHKYDDATINMLHQRREDHLNEDSKSYTADESLELIRKHKK
jgi:hypothetical protein